MYLNHFFNMFIDYIDFSAKMKIDFIFQIQNISQYYKDVNKFEL